MINPFRKKNIEDYEHLTPDDPGWDDFLAFADEHDLAEDGSFEKRETPFSEEFESRKFRVSDKVINLPVQPQDERIVSPATNPPGSIDIIRLKPEADQIDAGLISRLADELRDVKSKISMKRTGKKKILFNIFYDEHGRITKMEGERE